MHRLPVVNTRQDRLTFAQARVSPCASCSTSPCCTYLRLHDFGVANLRDLDYAQYLLNFDRIILGLHATGEWSAYYHYPCRFLSRQDFSCTIHDTPRQPHICVQYDPYDCWYKRSLTSQVSDEFLLVDRARLDFIAHRLVFNENRDIVEVPDWETLVRGLESFPVDLAPRFEEFDAVDDAAFDDWASQSRRGEVDEPVHGRRSYFSPDVQDPCLGCGAYCCTTLTFPLRGAPGVPNYVASLDYARYCLGFPGVELGISDQEWQIVVRTRCRHLDGNRCAVYGKDERPLRCQFYDSWTCHYKLRFGQPRPPRYLRVRLDQFDRVAECFELDDRGLVIRAPTVDELRAHVEARSRLDNEG